ncbi:hypothetical protein PR003_g17286 [Phytophthora rubi]|uniref:Uncharacterized protein n=1 Tax=Phytophthora rubi TaxID=129364 RepID=A0A6A4EFN6_9STRA|nr:hypothetical protein PR003_g17286 [Phytophthora rubi]
MADDAAQRLQQVVPLCDRVRCTDWMELDQALRGSKVIYGRTVDFVMALFRSSDRRVNMNKAHDWWKKREETAASLEDPAQLKFATSRQRIHHQLVRLRRAGVKLSNQLVAEMGVVFIEDSEHPRFNARLTVKGKPFTSMLTPRRIQDYLERYNIVYRRHKGNKQVSLEKQMQIDKDVAKHMGEIKRHLKTAR